MQILFSVISGKEQDTISWISANLWWVDYHIRQDAQLSQRDRAAACVIVFAKSRRLELGDNILQTL